MPVSPTIEEREEYELPVREGVTVYAGVDYGEILALAEDDADVVLWDGGNNDLPFYVPDLMFVVADALRPGHETAYSPGRVQRAARRRAGGEQGRHALPSSTWRRTVAGLRGLNPDATLLLARSPATLEDGPSIAGLRVLVVEDGPTITHGGMPFGAGTVAARAHRCCGVRGPAAVRGGVAAWRLREVPAHRRRASRDGVRR